MTAPSDDRRPKAATAPPWVNSYRGELGYEVRIPDRAGTLIGHLTHDPFTFPWRGWCVVRACAELGGTETKAIAAALVRKHWLESHG